MCGIFGFLNLDGLPIDPAIGTAMGGALRHRGPDDSGSLVDAGAPSVFLGHRRLSIIDLSASARQPLAGEDGKVSVVFNGEIYNHRALRNELTALGHRFRTSTDGEAIVHAYEQFGDDCVRRLDGMFAVALWDAKRRRLLLARDRNGKKPLYYASTNGRFTFASEIKALLACPWVDSAVAAEHIPELLMFGYVPTPRTIYRGIQQLSPASMLTVDRDGPGAVSAFWSLNQPMRSKRATLNEEQAALRVRDLVTATVTKRLESDVPLGAFLSGGIDSSIVVGVMSKVMKEPVRTFTIGFGGDPSYDERAYSAATARHFGTQHKEFVVEPDAAALAERLLWHHDQPYGDSSAIPTYLVCERAGREVRVALTGDGGDEVFAGYERFRAALVAEKLPAAFYPAARAAACLLPKRDSYFGLRRRLDRFTADADSPIFDRYLSWIAFFPPAMVRRLVKRDLAAHAADESLKRDAAQWWPEAEDWPLLRKLIYFNHSTYLPDDLLVKADRMSMAHGLELRSPLLDTELVEFAASLPPEMKIKNGGMKHILRRAFQDVLPEDVIRRRKHGFGVPMGLWFRTTLRRLFAGKVLCGGALVHEYLDPWALEELFLEHVSGAQDHGQRLWLLLNLELWLEAQRRGPTSPAPPACPSSQTR